MSEFYLCHVALVGARISAFQELGFSTRNDLAMRRVIPNHCEEPLCLLPPPHSRALLVEYFPVWVHNIISDPEFPQRHKLEMPLRRFEGELKDSKDNEVMSAVLSAGFNNRTLNPDKLPESMPLRQRCAIVAHIDAWQEPYLCLENSVLDILMSDLDELDGWIKFARDPGDSLIEDYSQSA
jgi:hypothetical protein